ncbi:MAG: PLDc N-terminal domain-containing protein [Desulfovibrionaceae bacterium]|jgi:bacteriorhodopsin
MFNLTATQWFWILAVGVLYVSLTFACILNVFKRFQDEVDRMLWTQICIIPFFGALTYLLIGRKRGEKKK